MRHPVIAAALMFTAPALLFAASPMPASIAAALADRARPAADRAADVVRLPAETMAFAGVKPGMVVGEFFPGSGYFTRLLAVAVGPRGHIYTDENERWKDGIKGNLPANVTLGFAPFGTVRFAKPLDLAWVTQNYHDLKIAEYGVVDTAAFNRAVFAALKPGGSFFILDHEALPGTTVAQIEKLHRIEKAQVIREVTAAGFKLVDEGTFLHRPGDDHSLPVSDKAIRGKTDQYALRFVKPRG